MASVKNLKKEVNYVLGDIINIVYIWEMTTTGKPTEASDALLDSIFDTFDTLMTKINQKGVENKKVHFKQPPVGLNTVAMLRTASSFLKISPHHTMVLAEKLYTSGYITYPRTETTKYASSFDFLGVLKDLSSDENSHASIVKNLLANFKKPALRGADVGDHPPITPSKCGKSLTGEMKRLYDMIAGHFVATLMDPAEYEERDYTLSFAGEYFTASSSVITKEGFLKI